MGVPEVIGYEKEGKTEQGSVYSIYLYIYIPSDYMILYYIILYDALRTSSRELYIKKITKQNI